MQAKFERPDEIVLGGKRLESAIFTLDRLRCSNMQLHSWHKQGLPRPLKIGNRRFFDPEIVDAWLLALIRPQNEAAG